MDEKDIRTIIIYAFQLQSLEKLVQERKDKLKFLVNQNKTLISKKKIYKTNQNNQIIFIIETQSEVDRLNYIIKINLLI